MATDHPRQRRNVNDVTAAYDRFRGLSDHGLPRNGSKLVALGLRASIKGRF